MKIKINFIITISILVIISIFTIYPYKLLMIQSGSMEKELKIGDAIIIKKEKNYKVGDIITFETKEEYLVTHRIVSITKDGYQTKGDSNNIEDEEIIKENQIKGKVIYHSTLLGKIIINKVIIILLLFFLLYLLRKGRINEKEKN